MNDKDAPVCLVTGVGPGTGSAIVRRFAEGGYRVAMVARNWDRLAQLEGEIANTKGYGCDVADPEQLDRTLQAVRDDLGAPKVVVHNAVRGTRGDFLAIDPQDLRRNFEINVMSYLQIARAVAPFMIEAGAGAIIATGNTAAYRGKDFFAGFAPTKAAQRILGESMARTLGPKGVHVAYLAIDAVIDVPWTREAFSEAPDDFFCKPSDIAHSVWQLAHQAKSAWTYDMVIRPFGENW